MCRVLYAGVPGRKFILLHVFKKKGQKTPSDDALEPEYTLIRELIDLRIKRGLSQRELAKRAGMQQPMLARVESGKTASLRTLRRVADALNADVRVSIVPRHASRKGKGKGTRR